MDAHTTPPAAAPATTAPAGPVASPTTAVHALADPAPDRLGAEVRESLLLLALCLGVTAGLSAGAQALLALAG